MTDLLYFGYGYEPESKSLEKEFIEEIKEEFPDVVLKDAYDSIKGYRQEVHLSEEIEDNYYCWMISHGWMNCSMTSQLKLMLDKEEFDRIFEMAKVKYPHKFKKEAL